MNSPTPPTGSAPSPSSQQPTIVGTPSVLGSASALKSKRWARMEAAVWFAIYGGLLLCVVGISAGQTSPALGWSLAAAGASAVAVGVVLIVIRSKLPD